MWKTQLKMKAGFHLGLSWQDDPGRMIQGVITCPWQVAPDAHSVPAASTLFVSGSTCHSLSLVLETVVHTWLSIFFLCTSFNHQF